MVAFSFVDNHNAVSPILEPSVKLAIATAHAFKHSNTCVCCQ